MHINCVGGTRLTATPTMTWCEIAGLSHARNEAHLNHYTAYNAADMVCGIITTAMTRRLSEGQRLLSAEYTAQAMRTLRRFAQRWAQMGHK